MKIQNIVLLVLGAVTLTAGAMAFGYYVTTQSTEEDSSNTDSARVAGASAPSSNALNVTTGGGSAGQLFGSSNDVNANPADEAPKRLPGPDEFEVYEEYANEQSALFADIEVGEGNEARPGDTVAAVYKGWFTDGTLFDESPTNKNGQIEAFQFIVGNQEVIPGWDQGISGMKIGGQRRLVIPYAVGYGEEGNDRIPPKSMLIFDVQLIDVKKAEQEPGL